MENKSLNESIRWWMKTQELFLSTLPDKSMRAIDVYCGNSFEKFNSIYQTSDVLNSILLDEDFRNFAALFVYPNNQPLPQGMLLFEGQGIEVRDILDLISLGRLHENLVLARSRPTSASWIPNAALDWLGENKPSKEFDGCNHPSLEEIAIHRHKFTTFGCLLVHKIKGTNVRGIFRHIMKNSLPDEAGVILQPDVKITIVKIEWDVEIPKLSSRRIAMNKYPVKCPIIYTEVEALNSK